MEAVGRLAGGIAHDFNNLLTVINGYGELILNGLRSGRSESRAARGDSAIAGERATHLTRQLLAFSRKQVLQPQVVSLNALLNELRKLLRPLIGEDIELTFVADPATGTREGRSRAVRAGDHQSGGERARRDAGRRTADHRDAQRRTGRRPRERISAKCGRADTCRWRSPIRGTAWMRRRRARIFEPFFTTKGPGRGRDWGSRWSTASSSNRADTSRSTASPATARRFKVYLPRANEKAPADAIVGSKRTKVPEGHETVLLVEDEAAVRTLARLVLPLERLHGAGGGTRSRGPRRRAAARGRIHLLVTDVVMPGMSGRELADLLLDARPAVRVLFMSGYTDEAVAPPRRARSERGLPAEAFQPRHARPQSPRNPRRRRARHEAPLMTLDAAAP